MKSLTIQGRRWRDSNGNTYHTAVAFVDGIKVAEVPRSYGYGSQYAENAQRELEVAGILKDKPKDKSLWQYCHDAGIVYTDEVMDVQRMKDLH